MQPIMRSAHITAMAHQQDILNHDLPEELQNKQINQGLQTIANLKQNGWTETQIVNNNGDDAQGALEQQTADRGAVGQNAIVNVGHSLHVFHLDDAPDSAKIALINADRAVTGQPEVDAKTIQGMAPQEVNNAVLAASNRFGQTPTPQNAPSTVAQWTTRYNTYKARPDADPDVLSRIKTELDNQKATLAFYNGNTADEAGKIAQSKADAEKQQTDASKREGTVPVFAVDKSGQTVLSTQDQATAQGFSAVRKVSQADIQKATNENNTLEAVTPSDERCYGYGDGTRPRRRTKGHHQSGSSIRRVQTRSTCRGGVH
jgi:hypothetical protein